MSTRNPGQLYEWKDNAGNICQGIINKEVLELSLKNGLDIKNKTIISKIIPNGRTNVIITIDRLKLIGYID